MITGITATSPEPGKIVVNVTTQGVGNYKITIDGVIFWQGSYGSQTIFFTGIAGGAHTVCATV